MYGNSALVDLKRSCYTLTHIQARGTQHAVAPYITPGSSQLIVLGVLACIQNVRLRARDAAKAASSVPKLCLPAWTKTSAVIDTRPSQQKLAGSGIIPRKSSICPKCRGMPKVQGKTQHVEKFNLISEAICTTTVLVTMMGTALK